MKLYRNLVGSSYFEVMRIPFVDGRDFAATDDGEAMPVAIVNREFARRYFEGRSPIGRRLTAWGRRLTIVGLVETTLLHVREIERAVRDDRPADAPGAGPRAL